MRRSGGTLRRRTAQDPFRNGFESPLQGIHHGGSPCKQPNPAIELGVVLSARDCLPVYELTLSQPDACIVKLPTGRVKHGRILTGATNIVQQTTQQSIEKMLRRDMQLKRYRSKQQHRRGEESAGCYHQTARSYQSNPVPMPISIHRQRDSDFETIIPVRKDGNVHCSKIRVHRTIPVA
jgi:hypothetical protein